MYYVNDHTLVMEVRGVEPRQPWVIILIAHHATPITKLTVAVEFLCIQRHRMIPAALLWR